jgi:hypothetical protein
MKAELEKKLKEDFPEVMVHLNTPYNSNHSLKSIECGDGWYNLIYAMCLSLDVDLFYKRKRKADIQDRLEEHDGKDRDALVARIAELDKEIDGLKPLVPVAVQIKEKFGGLRFYTNSSLTPEMQGARRTVEFLSERTCETCGAPGSVDSGPNHSYLICLCETHKKERYDKEEKY